MLSNLINVGQKNVAKGGWLHLHVPCLTCIQSLRACNAQRPCLRLKGVPKRVFSVLHIHCVLTKMVWSRGVNLRVSCLTYVPRAAWPCVGCRLWWQLLEESPPAYMQQPIFLFFDLSRKTDIAFSQKSNKQKTSHRAFAASCMILQAIITCSIQEFGQPGIILGFSLNWRRKA